MSQGGILKITTGSLPPSVPTSFTTNSGVAVPAANNLNVVGGTGITTSGSGSTVTITATGLSLTWNVVTSATNPNAIAKQNGYISKGASAVTFVLPASAAIGDCFIIAGYGNLWTLTQNAGQSVALGVQTTTVGVGGSITATQVRDSIEIVCVTANTEFQVINGVGNLTFV